MIFPAVTYADTCKLLNESTTFKYLIRNKEVYDYGCVDVNCICSILSNDECNINWFK